MNAVEILDIISDAYVVVFWTLFLVGFVVFLIHELVTGKFKEEEPDEDELMKKIDKIQETVDCLASEHIDAEAMKEIQNANSKPCITRNMALGFLDTLEGSFGVDPTYYDAKLSAAVEGLRLYIMQKEKNDADR